ncbi:hypothetical protein A4X20_20155 [Mycolicibacterium iranicum]|uniref:Uncharacterized protein n=1 Tax=Mycolicibacterium iranicum TaxID=912594 RepID=A0A178LVI5_MYCIR|nr:hypothetical protein A4X20_20155 [Mycolicibacterium iranicum]
MTGDSQPWFLTRDGASKNPGDLGADAVAQLLIAEFQFGRGRSPLTDATPPPTTSPLVLSTRPTHRTGAVLSRHSTGGFAVFVIDGRATGALALPAGLVRAQATNTHHRTRGMVSSTASWWRASG